METESRRYGVDVAGTKLTVTSDEHGIHLDGAPGPIPVVDRRRLRSFTGLIDGEEVPVFVEEGEGEHEYTVYIRGEAIPVTVTTGRDERILALRKSAAAGVATGHTVTAPMPGLLKQILVAVGDVVDKGKSLCILEAMKMENEIKSPGRHRVTRVIASAGGAVEKGAALLELGPAGDE
jgi:biotin carboxyl carrier protein